MKLGMVAGGPLLGVAAMAKTIEDHGYDSVWTAETSTTAYVAATIAAQATSRSRVGTAVALSFVRSPGISAMTAMDLDELSGGRFILGLGPQVKRVNEERFSTKFEHPAPKMKEYVRAIRAFEAGHFGEQPDFRGRFYSVTMAPWPRLTPPVRRKFPIYFAAVNKRMLEAAGEVADGVIGHPMTSPEYIRSVVLPSIELGAKRGGRDPAEVELAQQVIVSISDDREQAMREVKQQIGFYATTRTYTPVLAIHGFEDIVPSLREAFARKDMAALSALVTDEMADTFGIYGTADEVKEKVRKFEGLVGELTIGGPWYRVEPGRLAESYFTSMAAFAR